jgi:hypothetical protein
LALYGRYTQRFHAQAAAALWADERARRNVCALEAQYTCHLHHARLSPDDERDAIAVLGTMPSVVAAAQRARRIAQPGGQSRGSASRRTGNGTEGAKRKKGRRQREGLRVR